MVPSRRGKSIVRIVKPARRKRGGKRNRGITKDAVAIEGVLLDMFPAGVRPRSVREVSDRLGLSTQSVSSIIETAYREEILVTHVNLPSEVAELAELESAVCERFGLQQVLLVCGRREMLEPLSAERHRGIHTAVIRAMAGRVVRHLDGLLATVGASGRSLTLGVAWGRTMDLIAQHLRSTLREVKVPALEVVPIVGITGESLTEPTEANVIAMRFAEAYGGKSSQLACPAFVRREDEWLIPRLAQVRRMLRRIATPDIVLTSMGPIPHGDEEGPEITIASDPLLNPELVRAARAARAIGEICYWLFDENGAEVQSDHRSIGLGFKALQDLAADPKRQVILVAGGDRRRFAPLRAALEGKLASVLVSDTVTARALLERR